MRNKSQNRTLCRAMLRSWDILGVQRTEREREEACLELAELVSLPTMDAARLVYERMSSIDCSVRFRMSSEEFSDWYVRSVPTLLHDRVNYTAKSLSHVLSKYHAVAFKEFACTLWLFTHLLIARLLRDGVRDVFFLAREGQPLKGFFDAVASRRSLDTVIRSHYLVASRKATYLISLGESRSETFAALRTQYPHISPAEFLESLGFDGEDRLAILRECRVEYPFTRLPFFSSGAFDGIMRCARFHETFNRNKVSALTAFKAYLAGFGVPLSDAGLAVVDVGWKGSIQDNIFAALGGDVGIVGYYCGLTERRVISDRNKKVPLLFDVPLKSPFCRVFNECRPLFELMLAASHGGAVGYRLGNDGHASPVLHWEDKERALYEDHIRDAQEQFLEIIKELESQQIDLSLKPSHLRRLVAWHHGRMVFRPTTKEVTLYQSLSHHENFGVNQFADHKLGVRLSIASRGRRLFRLLRRPRQQLLQYIWPALSLRVDGLDFLRLPYGWAMTAYCFAICLRVLYHRVFRNTDKLVIRADTQYVNAQVEAIKAQNVLIKDREVYLRDLEERLQARGLAMTGEKRQEKVGQ